MIVFYECVDYRVRCGGAVDFFFETFEVRIVDCMSGIEVVDDLVLGLAQDEAIYCIDSENNGQGHGQDRQQHICQGQFPFEREMFAFFSHFFSCFSLRPRVFSEMPKTSAVFLRF